MREAPMGKAKKRPSRRSTNRANPKPTAPTSAVSDVARRQPSGTVPETIFKYEPLSFQSIQNFKNQSIYFGSPAHFNDPYDCAIVAEIEEPTDAEVELMRRSYMDRPNVANEARRQLRVRSPRFIKELFIRSATKVLHQRREIILKKNGVSCFSETNDNLLMWSHYASRCAGFCLEFRTRFIEPDKLRRVIYAERIPKINIVPLVVDRDWTQIMELFCTKSIDWEYEREWRYIHTVAGTLFTYKPEALKAIYCGPEIDQDSIETICLILRGQNPDVELYLGRRSNKEFKAEFDPTTYTSQIVAKERGLI
jgi:hypothetical protein